MVAPIFKKATDTAPGDATMYGVPDVKYAFDVLDGTHSTDRIQVTAIEGLTQAPDVVVYKSGTTIYARRTDTHAVLNSGTATSASAVRATINAALNVANTDGKAVVLIKPGTYLIDTGLTWFSNITLLAYGATIDCSSAATEITTINAGAAAANKNSSIYGLTIDHAHIGGPVKFFSTEANPSSDITLVDCKFKRPRVTDGEGRMLYFAHTYPGGTQPTVKPTNIRIINCDFDGTGSGGSTGEMVRIENARNATVTGCRFLNAPSTKAAALSLFGACVDSMVSNCIFAGNHTDIPDLYVKQSWDIRIMGNKFSTRLKLIDCRYVTINGNTIRLMEIADEDTANYTANTSTPSLQRGSNNITISGNLFNNVIVTPLTGTTASDCILFNLAGITANPPKQIAITGNEVKTNRWFIRFVSATGTPAIAVERVFIANNAISELVTTASGDGVIEIPDTTWTTNDGFKDFFITGNYFGATTAGTVPHDILLGSASGFGNMVIRDNWFRNNGVSNTNGYPTTVTRNFGLTNTTRYSNSGTISTSTTTAVVTHGVAYTPTLENIFVTPTTAWGNMTNFYVSNITSTQFTITCTGNNSSITLAWQVARRGGG